MRQHVQIVPDQGLVDRRRRQLQAVQTTQLMAQAFDAEATRPTQLEDQCFFLSSNFRRRRVMRRSALRAKSRSSVRFETAQPLPEGWTRDAEAATDRTRIPQLAIGFDPAQSEALFTFHPETSFG